jgi:hypothetical protein
VECSQIVIELYGLHQQELEVYHNNLRILYVSEYKMTLHVRQHPFTVLNFQETSLAFEQGFSKDKSHINSYTNLLVRKVIKEVERG